MKLRDYLATKRITAKAFGESLVPPVSEFGVGKWVRGERIPRREQMQAVREATHGLVTPDDFYASPTASADSPHEAV